MRKIMLFAVIATSAACRAEVVAELNEAAARIAAPPGSNIAVNTLALMNLAMFDSANAVERGFAPYRQTPAPPSGINPDAAALAAGCATLASMQPAQAQAVASACQTIAARLPAGAESDEARRFGERVATDLVASRKGEGLGAPNRYRPFTTAGTYVPTTLPVGWDVATMKPIALTSPSQFRPEPPPPLSGDVWARDYNEVKAVGARASTTRTAEQTATAQFWSLPGFAQFIDGIPDNAPAASTVAARARYYALVYMAMGDAAAAQFDAKYTYNFWRPITAIRNGGLDGNDATEPDVGWLSLIDAPLHPEYPCAHCNVAAAVATVVAGMNAPGKRITVRGANNTRREFATADALLADVVNARVYSGIHFRTSAETGAAMGRKVGAYILTTQLRPLP